MRRFKIQTLMVIVAVSAAALVFAMNVRHWFQEKHNLAWPAAHINGFAVMVLLAIAPIVGLIARHVRIEDVPPDESQPNDVPGVGRIDHG
jgi:hypothetical protein